MSGAWPTAAARQGQRNEDDSPPGSEAAAGRTGPHDRTCLDPWKAPGPPCSEGPQDPKLSEGSNAWTLLPPPILSPRPWSSSGLLSSSGPPLPDRSSLPGTQGPSSRLLGPPRPRLSFLRPWGKEILCQGHRKISDNYRRFFPEPYGVEIERTAL